MADLDLCVFKSRIPLAQQNTDSEALSQRRRCIWSTSVYEDTDRFKCQLQLSWWDLISHCSLQDILHSSHFHYLLLILQPVYLWERRGIFWATSGRATSCLLQHTWRHGKDYWSWRQNILINHFWFPPKNILFTHPHGVSNLYDMLPLRILQTHEILKIVSTVFCYNDSQWGPKEHCSPSSLFILVLFICNYNIY